MVPDYLSILFPRSDNDNQPYNLRNRNDFINIPRRTHTFESSFVPSAIELWNSLPSTLREIQSISSFKRKLVQTMFSPAVVPAHFLHGSRHLSIFHARLRNKCSDLKYDLFLNHVSEHDLCIYCNMSETADHYLFHCTRYTNERLQLFEDTRQFHPLNCEFLLIGSSILSNEQNLVVVDAVHKYIKNTKRFMEH